MARLIALMGESGSGKTTSMRNLDPATTLYIDCDKKGLAWKGWKSQYNKENQNYIKTDSKDVVLTCLKSVQNNEQYAHYKTVVIDTINGIMVADEMRRSGEKNYDKWMDLAVSVYNIIDYALTMKDELTVIFVAHSQTTNDDFGYSFTHIKTSGKKLDKIVLESKFPTVLWAKRNGSGEYVFEVHANNSTAKTPLGAYEVNEIPNDISAVIKVLEEF